LFFIACGSSPSAPTSTDGPFAVSGHLVKFQAAALVSGATIDRAISQDIDLEPR